MQLPGAFLNRNSKNKNKQTNKKRLKNFLYFLKNKNLLSYFGKQNFLIFPKIELSRWKTKKFQEGTFQVQKVKNPTLKEFLIFWEIEFSSPKLKKLLIFQEETLKTFLIYIYFFIFKEILKISLYILHHNILHQNY